MLSSRGRARFAARVEGSVVRRCRRAAGNKRRSFDCAPARPAKEAGRKFFAGAPLRGCDFIGFSQNPMLKTDNLHAKKTRKFKKVTNSQDDTVKFMPDERSAIPGTR